MDKKEEQGFNINVPTAIIIAGLFIAGAIVISNSPKGAFVPSQGGNGNTAGNAIAPSKDIVMAPVTDQDHYYGNPNAKVLLVEYSDLECPFCKRFQSEVKNIVDNSKGQVAWVYRHFPLDQLHSKARNEAYASECASELGGNDKFWEYVDALFAVTPSNNGLDPAQLPKLAAQVGLDASKFSSCLSSGKYKDKVEASVQDGVKVGVTGTPTTVIMNRKGEKTLLVGAQPEEAIQAAINSVLK